MEKTARMELIEARAGKDIRDVLRDAYDEVGNLTAAADLLGERYGRDITQGTLTAWIAALDGRIVKTLEFGEAVAA